MLIYELVLACAVFGQPAAEPLSAEPPLTPVPQTTDDRVLLENAIRTLEKEIAALCRRFERRPLFAGTTPSQPAFTQRVTEMSDLLSDNSLLTRAYLALALAELRLVGLNQRASELESVKLAQLKEHAEIVEIAIDSRLLDEADRRVYQALRAEIRENSRLEIERLRQHGASDISLQRSGQCCSISSGACERKCRVFSHLGRIFGKNH